jgi:hypothetical protein
MLVCRETGVRHRAFQFFRTPSDFTVTPQSDMLADLLATLEKDSFRGQNALALRIADIVLPRA